MEKTGPETKANYFRGTSRDNWKTGLSTYNEVLFSEVYQGIDLTMKVYGNSIEKIFTVKPGAESGQNKSQA